VRAVWKFPLGAEVLTDLSMPADARIVHVDRQGAHGCIWAEVDTEATLSETRRFLVRGTGMEIPAGHEHVGTWQEPPFVWHLYENVIGADR
jgi:hypothetical protein